MNPHDQADFARSASKPIAPYTTSFALCALPNDHKVSTVGAAWRLYIAQNLIAHFFAKNGSEEGGRSDFLWAFGFLLEYAAGAKSPGFTGAVG